MSERQCVVFKLEGEDYGIDIMNVREITELKVTTKIPNTPDFIDGVINIRGSVVPIINLKKRFKLETTEIRKNSRIIIVNMNEKQIGFIVDEASQVTTLMDDNIDKLPEIIAGEDKKYIVGIVTIEDKTIILLDLIATLSEKERKEVEEIN